MSYFDYYSKNVDNNRRNDTDKIQGTCHSMCPTDEIKMRERERLVHVLEVSGTSRRLVKCYSRSAADSNMAVPRLLRPYDTLSATVNYLLVDAAKRQDVNASVVYDFINDRLRAVRQDMTIQRLSPEHCMALLEPMIRFHVYFGYRLCEYPIKDYDPTLNRKYLLECMKWFLSCCDTVASQKENIDNLTGLLSDLQLSKKLPCDRALIESLYILCNLDDVHPLFRYCNLPKQLKSNPTIQLAYKIAIANMSGNYVYACKQLEKLCPLTYCALATYIPRLQRQALLVMSAAYSSRQLAVPASAVRRWVLFNSDAEVLLACRHYSIPAEGDRIKFFKGQFSDEAAMHQPMKQLLLDEKIDLTIENVFTYVLKT